jgi:hypothetical protein
MHSVSPCLPGRQVFGYLARDLPVDTLCSVSAYVFIPGSFRGDGVALVMSGDQSEHAIAANLSVRDSWQHIEVSAWTPEARHHAAPTICIWGSANLTVFSTGWEIAVGRPRSSGSAAELFRCFESLGDNCEFGMVQRRSRHDPPGLFRNVGFQHIGQMTSAIDQDFEGMFEPGNYDYMLRPGWPDYALHCRRFGFAVHTALPVDHPLSDDKRASNIKAFRFLVDKLRRDLAEGEKTFVFRSSAAVELAAVVALHQAVRRHGPGWTLCVRPDPKHGPRVDTLCDGLQIASLPRLSSTSVLRVDFNGWERLAEASLLLRRDGKSTLSGGPLSQ